MGVYAFLMILNYHNGIGSYILYYSYNLIGIGIMGALGDGALVCF